jgi:hypothetical protein
MDQETTKLEKDWKEKVKKYLKDQGGNRFGLSRLGNHPRVKYSNIEKLDNFINHDIGTMSGRVMGRIEAFIDWKKSTKDAK